MCSDRAALLSPFFSFLLLVAATAAHGQEGLLDRLEQRQAEQQRALDEIKAAATPRVSEVERQQSIVAREIARLRDLLVLPERAELKSAYGLGPAASKVYYAQPGLSLGGYGESYASANLTPDDGQGASFDLARFVVYAGFKFNDWLLVNSEIEVEHATTEDSGGREGGAVEVELVTLDALLHRYANLRGGLVLIPMGFINEIHEPPFFHGNLRPPVEVEILPSTWRANGFGLFGELASGIEYRTYGVTSLDGKRLRPEGLRAAKPNGGEDLADDWSWVGRIDLTRWDGIAAGASAYVGDQGQSQAYGNDVDGYRRADVFTQIYEVHAQYRRRGLELRALGTVVLISDTAILNRDPEITGVDPAAPPNPPVPVHGVAKQLWGAYGEIAYDIMPHLWPETTQLLAPWFRYSALHPQAEVGGGIAADRRLERSVYEIGLTYKPIPQVVLKLDGRIQSAETGGAPEELHIGGGFVF